MPSQNYCDRQYICIDYLNCLLSLDTLDNLPTKVQRWNVFVGTHPHPTVFPNGRIFGTRAGDTDQPHPTEGMKLELFMNMPEVMVQLLHECVTKVTPGKYEVIYEEKERKGKTNTIRLAEGTHCPAMRPQHSLGVRHQTFTR